MYRFVMIAALLCASLAHAESRVAVLGFKGPKAAAVRAQIVERLCQVEECVSRGRKGQKVQVDGVVTGTMTRAGSRYSLEVQIFTSEDVAPVKVRVPVRSTGKLSDAGIAAVVSSVQGTVTPYRPTSAPDDDPVADAK
ncbi:MAG: hypothetical protein WBV82_23075 [Myxococcaceae bacterium]